MPAKHAEIRAKIRYISQITETDIILCLDAAN